MRQGYILAVLPPGPGGGNPPGRAGGISKSKTGKNSEGRRGGNEKEEKREYFISLFNIGPYGSQKGKNNVKAGEGFSGWP